MGPGFIVVDLSGEGIGIAIDQYVRQAVVKTRIAPFPEGADMISRTSITLRFFFLARVGLANPA